MNQVTETVTIGGTKFEVTCEYSAFEPATHTDPEVPAEFYVVSIMRDGEDWFDYFTPEMVKWFAEDVREKMA